MSAVVSANDAAHHVGVSEKTVRRWIRSGRLKADKRGRAYRVSLSEVAALVGPDTAHDGGPAVDSGQTADIDSAPPTADARSAMSGLPELVALVDRLVAENRRLAETAAVWQERAQVLADRLALASPAPSERPVAGQRTPEPSEPTPEPPRPFPWLSARPVMPIALVAVVVLLAAAGVLLLR